MATSPNDLTRQQLDELDALLQKMLAVPIAPTEPVAAPAPAFPEPPAATWRMDPPAPVLHRTPHLSTPAPNAAEPAFAGRPVEESAVILETRVDPRGFARPEAPAPGPRLFGFTEPTVVTPEPVYVPPPIQNRNTILKPGPSGFVGIDDDTPDEAITVDPPAVTFQPAMTLPFNPADDTAAVPLAMAGGPAPAPRGVPLPLWPVYAANAVIEGTLSLFGPPGELVRHPAVKAVLGVGGIGLLGYAGFWVARGMGWVTL
jgi:hypothetical protein